MRKAKELFMVQERLCRFAVELFEEMQRKTQNRARLPNHYHDRRKSSLKVFHSKAYI
jgi:hypothetical protein